MTAAAGVICPGAVSGLLSHPGVTGGVLRVGPGVAVWCAAGEDELRRRPAFFEHEDP